MAAIPLRSTPPRYGCRVDSSDTRGTTVDRLESSLHTWRRGMEPFGRDSGRIAPPCQCREVVGVVATGEGDPFPNLLEESRWDGVGNRRRYRRRFPKTACGRLVSVHSGGVHRPCQIEAAAFHDLAAIESRQSGATPVQRVQRFRPICTTASRKGPHATLLEFGYARTLIVGYLSIEKGLYPTSSSECTVVSSRERFRTAHTIGVQIS